MYEVQLERRVEKQLDGLPTAVFERILGVFRELSEEPRPRGCRKLSGSRNDWRVRVGSYRIVYEIDDGEGVVRVNWIGHRRDAY